MNELFDTCAREIARDPGNPDPYLRLGDLLHGMERFEDAVAVYDRLLAVMPDCGPVHHNRGNALLEMGRWEEAIRSYRTALNLMPGFVEAYVTIATALQALGRPFEAMASCHRALSIDPECAEAHWNLALALLQIGEYGEGWEEFQWRWKKRGYTSRQRNFLQPEWDGAPLSGRTILLHCEQGFGDSIQFARFIPLAAERGGRVVVECPAQLKGLMEGVKGVSEAVASGEDLPEFDLHLPLMSLPRVFGARIDSLPRKVPYLLPTLEKLAEWSPRFTDVRAFRVGIVWEGRRKPDPNRTCPFRFLAPLSELSGIAFYSLQIRENGAQNEPMNGGPKLVDLTSEIRDFGDTAALIAHLDLVISIDTGVAHLSGALGKETWVMLPHAADWRWMLDRDDSPWYPTARLFRQKSPGDWPGVVSEMRKALDTRLARFQGEFGRYSNELEAAYSGGLSLLQERMAEAAEDPLRRALLEDPRVPEVFNALGVCAREQGKGTAAVSLFRHAVALDPGYADGHINLGNALYADDLIEEAVDQYRRALAVSPEDIRAHQNLGVALQAQGRIAEAAASFETALTLRPDYATARWNRAMLKLLTGNLREGFRDFEARFEKNDPVPVRYSGIPLWDGTPFHGKTLLVHAEQGFGDTFQFVRYLRLVAERGENIIFECQHESLRDIVSNSFPYVKTVVRGEAPPPLDYQIPLLSLPRVFDTSLGTIPAAVPYLIPSGEKLAKWKKRLEGDTGLRIGLVWAGRAIPDPKRSASLQALAPLASVPGALLYSLQVGEGSEQLHNPPAGMKIHDFTHELRDFSETAAFIANLDLIVTIDSAAAHLGGALGKPVHLLLPWAPDWRWMSGRTDSPWYPGMQLLRQKRPGDWSWPVAMVKERLQTLIRQHGVY
jgi:tetratricopeptide (TPR) repeat protein